MPGQEVFVSRGAIEVVPTEGALAGLLAHQISTAAVTSPATAAEGTAALIF